MRADLLAVALLSVDEVWLFTLDEARMIAQQHAETGGRRLYWYTDPDTPPPAGSPLKQADVGDYLLERRAPTLFP